MAGRDREEGKQINFISIMNMMAGCAAVVARALGGGGLQTSGS